MGRQHHISKVHHYTFNFFFSIACFFVHAQWSRCCERKRDVVASETDNLAAPSVTKGTTVGNPCKLCLWSAWCLTVSWCCAPFEPTDSEETVKQAQRALYWSCITTLSTWISCRSPSNLPSQPLIRWDGQGWRSQPAPYRSSLAGCLLRVILVYYNVALSRNFFFGLLW